MKRFQKWYKNAVENDFVPYMGHNSLCLACLESECILMVYAVENILFMPDLVYMFWFLYATQKYLFKVDNNSLIYIFFTHKCFMFLFKYDNSHNNYVLVIRLSLLRIATVLYCSSLLSGFLPATSGNHSTTTDKLPRIFFDKNPTMSSLFIRHVIDSIYNLAHTHNRIRRSVPGISVDIFRINTARPQETQMSRTSFEPMMVY